MLGPAPVSLDPAGDGGAGRWALVVLHGLAIVALLAWWPSGLSALAAMVMSAAGVWSWRHPVSTGRLAWDGQTWRFGAEPVRPTVALDLGGWMLLRLQVAGGRGHWLPLSPARAGAAWPALRAALYATPVPAA